MDKKRGAPKKTEETAKRGLLQIRLSQAEKEAFRLAAEIDGKKISEWIRDRLRRIARDELQSHGQEVAFLAPSESGKKSHD